VVAGVMVVAGSGDSCGVRWDSSPLRLTALSVVGRAHRGLLGGEAGGALGGQETGGSRRHGGWQLRVAGGWRYLGLGWWS
jgi:hypothetical protein